MIETARTSAGIDAYGRHDQATDQVAFRGAAHKFLPIGFGFRGQDGTCCEGHRATGPHLTLRRTHRPNRAFNRVATGDAFDSTVPIGKSG